MNRFGSPLKPLTWLMASLLAAFLAGCGGGGDGGGSRPSFGPAPVDQAGGVCAGAGCVALGTAGSFVILNQAAITNVPTSPITGNVGTSPITGAAIGVTCAEVSGTIYDTDGAYTGGGAPDVTCRVTDATRLTAAIGDSVTAYGDAAGRPAGVLNLGGGTVTAQTLTAGTYTWGTPVNITGNLTLSGSATDIWIFQVGGTLTQAAATTMVLAGGAKAQNIFWQVSGSTNIGGGAHFEGIILSPSDINLVTGASLNGRLYSGTAVNLDQNAITRPAP